VQVRPRGLAGDRRFLLVGADGSFICQRQIPKLTQLCVKLVENGISLSWPDQDWTHVPEPSHDTRRHVTIWRSNVNASLIDGEINGALSAWLGREVSLVFMDASAARLANQKWTPTKSQVSFADGYPILIANTASLKALNNHILNSGGDALGMDRFRPNIVIDCDEPWAEDSWKSVHVGDVILDLVKPCARCVMTSIDQSTGKKHPKTALAALKHLHPSTDPNNPGVLFGWNAVVRQAGSINTGDTLTIDPRSAVYKL